MSQIAPHGEVRQREPRKEDKRHLAFIRKLPCAICGYPWTEAAHVRAPNPDIGKRQTGKGEKPSDCWTVPLCSTHHRAQHGIYELEFWDLHGRDPFALSQALYEISGNEDAALAILSRSTP